MGWVTFKILCCYGISMAGGRQEEGIFIIFKFGKLPVGLKI